jgi:hypothetical protein
MALRDKISGNFSSLLQPGETVQQVFVGQTKSGWWQTLGLLGLLIARPKVRPVAVTDRRIIVAEGSIWAISKVNGMVSEHPRSTELGRPTGLWWRTDALGEPLFVPKRFHKDILAANAAIGR